MSYAIVFPGQGSQAVGMLSELSETFSAVGDTFARASKLLGYDLWRLCQNGPVEQLNQTEFTQPALLCADVALYRCWHEVCQVVPDVMAGHSLGEYSALVCADVMDFDRAVVLVAKRGRYMQDAVPSGVGAMGVIVGCDDAAVLDICARATAVQGQLVTPANYNSIGQTVIAGAAQAVDRALDLAKKQGAKMAKRIAVSVPSHCALMQPAADQLAVHMKDIPLALPRIDVIHNVDAKRHATIASIRDALIHQLIAPVQWVKTIQALSADGVSDIIECGPGAVLKGLIRRIDKRLAVHSINTPQALQDTADRLSS